jgi:ATP-binding cassette subfamily B protein RaxB
VRIGGQHIFDLSEDRKAQLMSSVMQEDFLFCGSVSENVASFRNPINAPLVEESLKISGLWHDVEQMPMGIDTLLGEMGMSLSSGQKQRLLLARALYVNPKLLVLDEATSNLDHETQRIVTDSLRQRKFGVVYVTHRPESLTFIKRICLLTSSGLVEVSQQPRTHSHSQEALE